MLLKPQKFGDDLDKNCHVKPVSRIHNEKTLTFQKVYWILKIEMPDKSTIRIEDTFKTVNLTGNENP